MTWLVVDGRGDDDVWNEQGVELVWAGGGQGSADDRIVELVAEANTPATVVTADRGLRDRLRALDNGVMFEGPSSFRTKLGP